MIPFEQALDMVLGTAVVTGTEHVPMAQAVGRVLAEEIVSDMDMPPFDKSAVDGFAICDANGTPPGETYRVLETIAAGKPPVQALSPGTCSRIMTGAMIPGGTTAVVMVEDTESNGDGVMRITRVTRSGNICRRGEDIRLGEPVLPSGTWLAPQHIAVLASMGAVSPLVHKQPRTGIIATGDELTDAAEKPGLSQIRNSNTPQLIAQCAKAGISASDLGIARDTEHDLGQVLNAALTTNDIVILTGGVSMGDFDHVPAIMEQAGVKILFRTVAIQPGKPTVFGIRDGKYVFGLPGNPVSSFVLFEVLVKPFLLKLMGWNDTFPLILMPMGKDYTRKRSDRLSFIPVRIINGEVFPVEYHGSAHINAYSAAHGIIPAGIGVTEIRKGTMIHVRPV